MEVGSRANAHTRGRASVECTHRVQLVTAIERLGSSIRAMTRVCLCHLLGELRQHGLRLTQRQRTRNTTSGPYHCKGSRAKPKLNSSVRHPTYVIIGAYWLCTDKNLYISASFCQGPLIIGLLFTISNRVGVAVWAHSEPYYFPVFLLIMLVA